MRLLFIGLCVLAVGVGLGCGGGGGGPASNSCSPSNPTGACPAEQTCVSGACCAAGSACAGDGGVPDGGTPICGPGNCAGCCAGNSCIPLASEAHGECGATGAACAACPANKYCETTTGLCHPSHIEHVVLIVQENHSFETYFGRYCTAPAGSNPTCTRGPSCCEGAPGTEPSGSAAYALNDDPANSASNFAKDRDHNQVCELQQINGGAMNHFVSGSTGASTCYGVGPTCADRLNWVLADGSTATSTVNYYWSLATGNALADRYFQPIAGGSASNNIYFAGAHFRFVDNGALPNVVVGESGDKLCVDSAGCLTSPKTAYPNSTVADLLVNAGYSFTMYADGFSEANAATLNGTPCPSISATSECPYSDCYSHPVACHGCLYNPADIPFLFYQGFTDISLSGGVRPTPYEKDLTALQQDISQGTLPNFAFVKERLFHNEHPNLSTIADGAAAVSAVVNLIEQSAFRNNTLILLTWDEGGGFFDHVPPPPALPTSLDSDASGNAVPYGTRVPLVAIGPLAKAGTVSHVTMEHSSIVSFLEFNFLGIEGGLGARDAVVNNIGSLLDPVAVGVDVPSCNSSCLGRHCGLNGCGVSCGACASGSGCSAGSCVSCTIAVPAGTCATGQVNCGGQCCPAGNPWYCATNNSCYPTAAAAVASPCGSSCLACQ